MDKFIEVVSARDLEKAAWLSSLPNAPQTIVFSRQEKQSHYHQLRREEDAQWVGKVIPASKWVGQLQKV